MFTVNNLKTGQSETRPLWPEQQFGTPASEFKYRFNWQAPFLISPHDPNTIYFAGNVVFRTRDEGMTWEVISPDLTHNMTDKMAVAGSPWLPEYFGQEIFSTIHRLEEAPLEQGVLWAGSDDGGTPPERFYVVGGGWRALARFHLVRQGAPLRIVHGLELDAS